MAALEILDYLFYFKLYPSHRTQICLLVPLGQSWDLILPHISVLDLHYLEYALLVLNIQLSRGSYIRAWWVGKILCIYAIPA